MKVAIYCRVSTEEQDYNNQLPAIKAWCDRNGAEIVVLYQETASAWQAGHQAELARLLDDLRSGKHRYDYLVVWALDRLCRQGSAAILNLVNSFGQLGVKVISIQEPWTEAPGELGEIFLAIAGWSARIESKRRSERTKAGLDRVRKFGSKSGRGIGQRGKDNGQRHRAGYLNRWAVNKGAVKKDV